MNRVVGEGIEELGKDLFLASSESDQSEIQKTFRDPPGLEVSEWNSSYRDLGFRETFIADPEPGGGWSGFSGDRRTLLPPERGHHPAPGPPGGHHPAAGPPGGHHPAPPERGHPGHHPAPPDHLILPGESGHPDHLGQPGHPSYPNNRLNPPGPSPFPNPGPRIQLNPGFDSQCPS